MLTGKLPGASALPRLNGKPPLPAEPPGWLVVLVVPAEPSVGLRPASSQKPAFRPPQRSSVPRKPRRLDRLPSVLALLTEPLPSLFTRRYPESSRPKISTDWALTPVVANRPAAARARDVLFISNVSYGAMRLGGLPRDRRNRTCQSAVEAQAGLCL